LHHQVSINKSSCLFIWQLKRWIETYACRCRL